MNNNELIALSASEVRRQLDRGDLSPLDVFNAVAERIAAVNPIVNALPTLCLEAAHDRAAQLTKDQVPVAKRGALWGLPLAVKDYNDLAGVKTTYGSPIFATNVPNISDATVASDRMVPQGDGSKQTLLLSWSNIFFLEVVARGPLILPGNNV